MTYFSDGTTYRYWADSSGPGAVNVGWLDACQPFDVGEVAQPLVDALKQLCAGTAVNRTRGYHSCDLCASSNASRTREYPVRVALGDGEFVVGDAEIRVRASNGTIYAAPNMIIHYVEEHAYRPPAAFLDALTQVALGGSLE